MIKKTLYFGNPAYLSLRMGQLVIKLPEVEKVNTLPDSLKAQSVVTRPIEDIGIVVLDNKQITITQGLLEALLENNCAVITCDSHCMPVGLMLPLCENGCRWMDSACFSFPSMCGIVPAWIMRRYTSNESKVFFPSLGMWP